MQGGRCPGCGGRRRLRHLLLELASGCLFVACFTRFGVTGRAFVAAGFCVILLALAAIDAERRIVPNAIVVPAGIVVLIADAIAVRGRALEFLVAAAATSLAFLALALAYRGALGMGDVKLAFLLGAGLGRDVGVALLISMVIVFLLAVGLLAIHGLGARKQSIPLAPALAFGAIVALLTA
jgi:leader peptidase (prepilin peptidase)/N-methyltransferase